jgi:hypothetical protein
MKVVLVKPMCPPEITEIGNDLKSMQSVVGGCIEQMCPFKENVAIVCNEEGKLLGLPLNRAVRDEDNKNNILDIIAGDFFICDASGENFDSLSEEQLIKYFEMFQSPERFYREGSSAKAKIVVCTEENDINLQKR